MMDCIKSFCNQFDIDTYESREYQYADLLKREISFEDILANQLDYEALKEGAIFKLYRYNYSELWEGLEASCSEMLRSLEDKILEIGKTGIPITYIRRRQKEINDSIDSCLAKGYVQSVIEDAGVDDSFVFYTSDLHTHNELIATLHAFYTDVLQPQVNNLVTEYEHLSVSEPDNINPQESILKSEADGASQIDSESLKQYFSPAFNRSGNGGVNYFNMMIEDLRMNRSAKGFAQIALMAWEGSKMNHRKPARFSEWYGIFCTCVGCEKKTYQPKDLRNPPRALKSLFNYLE